MQGVREKLCEYCNTPLTWNRPCEIAKKRFCNFSCQGAAYRKNTEKGWAIVKLSRIKGSAKRRKLEFNLETEDLFPRPDLCPYLGIPLDYSADALTPNSASLNRVDNNKGYVKGNVELISTKANTMLNSASKEELIFFAKKVLEKHGSDTD